MTGSSPSGAEPADLRVVAGHPTADEVAAVVVALSVSASAQRSAEAGRRSGEQVSTAWNAPSRRMRPVVRRGPRAWRRNALPH